MKCKRLENQLCIRTTGQYRLCCVSCEPDNIENVKTHTIDDWINSKIKKDTTEALDKNKWPDACIRCKTDEENGVISTRQKSEHYGPGITHLDLRFGNSCNLSCRMCWPESSSSLVKEQKELVANNQESPWGTLSFVVHNWYDTDIAIKLASIPTLKEVYLTGGEPMMVNGLLKFIQLLDKKVTLRFNTNGTLLNFTLLEEIKKFEKVNMCFSIDGVGKINDYIRWGSRWEDVYRNFKSCKDAGFDVSIGPTIQVLNEFYMPELRQWASNEGVDLFENILANPYYYSIETAPWRSENNKAHIDFIKYTKILDSKRGCSIVDYLPEVAQAYGIN
jgi:MoaA/NifB/PqqE/SkfB family radical SAM enzyme